MNKSKRFTLSFILAIIQMCNTHRSLAWLLSSVPCAEWCGKMTYSTLQFVSMGESRMETLYRNLCVKAPDAQISLVNCEPSWSHPGKLGISAKLCRCTQEIWILFWFQYLMNISGHLSNIYSPGHCLLQTKHSLSFLSLPLSCYRQCWLKFAIFFTMSN